jgi:hypothetical protein
VCTPLNAGDAMFCSVMPYTKDQRVLYNQEIIKYILYGSLRHFILFRANTKLSGIFLILKLTTRLAQTNFNHKVQYESNHVLLVVPKFSQGKISLVRSWGRD